MKKIKKKIVVRRQKLFGFTIKIKLSKNFIRSCKSIKLVLMRLVSSYCCACYVHRELGDYCKLLHANDYEN